MKKLIRLHPDDPIGIALSALAAGERVDQESDSVCLLADIAPGHKVALRAIAAGEQVRRNAVGIGSATRDIAPGEHVHLHNLKSDYIPTLNRHYQDRQGLS